MRRRGPPLRRGGRRRGQAEPFEELWVARDRTASAIFSCAHGPAKGRSAKSDSARSYLSIVATLADDRRFQSGPAIARWPHGNNGRRREGARRARRRKDDQELLAAAAAQKVNASKHFRNAIVEQLQGSIAGGMTV